MEKEWNVLVVSHRANAHALLPDAFHALPVNAFVVGTNRQAREMLASLSFDMVFCEESTPDGSYRELLNLVLARHRETRFITILSSDRGPEFLEATQSGATGAIPGPLDRSDVGMIFLHAMMEQNEPRRTFHANR
jgi:DNA-binding NtrC family response regulator